MTIAASAYCDMLTYVEVGSTCWCMNVSTPGMGQTSSVVMQLHCKVFGKCGKHEALGVSWDKLACIQVLAKAGC